MTIGASSGRQSNLGYNHFPTYTVYMADGLPGDSRFSAYTGLWVALVRGEISGIGRSAQAARLASLDARPK